MIANTNNQLQERTEGTRLGIPAVLISNPRNHYTTIADISNLEEAEDYYVTAKDEPGQFTIFPDSLGLAATRDLDLIRDFAQIARKEWTSSGLRKMYGYNADLATQPLWSRILETFGEDPKLVSDINYTLIKGFQGEELERKQCFFDNQSIFLVGDQDIWGEIRILRKEILIFIQQKGACKSIICHLLKQPSKLEQLPYSLTMLIQVIKVQIKGFLPITKNQQFEEVGFIFNKAFITDLLREKLGFKGYVNSDTGATIGMAWGVKDLPMEERVAKALEAGANIFSGQNDPQPIINAVEQGLVSEEKINQSVAYLLTEMMDLGLFENPYVDPKKALEVVNNPRIKRKGRLSPSEVDRLITQ